MDVTRSHDGWGVQLVALKRPFPSDQARPQATLVARPNNALERERGRQLRKGKGWAKPPASRSVLLALEPCQPTPTI